ncbi:NADH-quinone oxidoreductase subunit NuoE [Candidatus Chlorohelix sp.]|uniref:NADH-quinone oxidoreductase subunit NuoE n=1 Tax=Candidatus Chlorohelix sp. TaxID=3139201 RepID=UPI003042B85A
MNNGTTASEHKLSEEARQRIYALRNNYPEGRSASAVIPALHIVQAEIGFISTEAVGEVAGLLDMLVSEVEQVVTFYRMFFTKPVGKYVIKVCDSISCYLRGSDELLEKGKEKLSLKLGETTPDGRITLMKIECLAACSAAPCAQVNDEYVYNLNPELFVAMLEELKTAEENPYYLP